MSIGTAKDIIELKMPDLVGDPRIDDFIGLAAFYVVERIFTVKYQYALALVALHMFMLDKQSGGDSASSGSGAIGGLKSEKEGDLSRTYGGLSGSISENKVYYMQTNFGQELLGLFSICVLGPRNRLVNGR